MVIGLIQVNDPYSSLSAICVTLVFTGCIGGYTSVRLYTLLRGKRRRLCILSTALALPCTFYLLVFVLLSVTIDMPLSSYDPSVLRRASSIVFLSAPLSVLGSFVATRQKPWSPRTNVPVAALFPALREGYQEWYAVPAASILMGAFIPFVAGCVQLQSIIMSIWAYSIVSLTGMFLWLALAVFVACPLTGLLTTAFGFMGGSPAWWWRSFLVGAASTVYFAVYFGIYYWYNLGFEDSASMVMYVVYCAAVVVAYAVAAGAAGTLASLFFMSKLFKVRNNKFISECC